MDTVEDEVYVTHCEAIDVEDVVIDLRKAKDQIEEHVEREYVWSDIDHEHFTIASNITTRLPAGMYRVGKDMNGRYILQKMKITTDDLIVLPDSTSEAIVAEIEAFWNMKPQFDAHGFIHKRGVLLWGEPGGGKTVTVNLIVNEIIKRHQGIAVLVENPVMASNILQDIRKVEPNRPIVLVMEDFEDSVSRYGETEFLSLLDGENQVDNIVFLATTNYPENLHDRITDRPSRFDTVEYIGMPDKALRREFITRKLPNLSEAELYDWVEKTDGFSIAHLKEMIIMTQCYRQPLEAVIERMRDRKFNKISSTSTPNKVKMGFNTSAGKD